MTGYQSLVGDPALIQETPRDARILAGNGVRITQNIPGARGDIAHIPDGRCHQHQARPGFRRRIKISGLCGISHSVILAP